MVLNRRLGKTKYYALRIEFQESNTLYIHSFIWIFKATNIHDETAYNLLKIH